MNNPEMITGCACCVMNRRRFLTASSSACAAAFGALALPTWAPAATSSGKVRVRIIYALHAATQPGPDWPNKGFEFQPVMDRITASLSKQCQGFEFVTSLATGEEEAKKILDQDRAAGIDGYVVCQMNCWNRVVQAIAASGKPVVYADFQYGGSGGFLVYTAAFLRQKAPNVGFVASSRIQDLIQAVKCLELVKKGGSVSDFVGATAQLRVKRTPKASNGALKPDELKTLSAQECLKRMKTSKILAVRGQESGPVDPVMNIPVVNVPFAEVNEAWKAADKDEARAVADRWEKTATQVVGVTR